jgi:hypothetical protein
MNHLIKVIVGLSLAFTIGCAHQINITPPLNTLPTDGISKIDKNVGYYISADDLSKEVITPGGGGDKIKYFSYRDSAPALNKILSNIFTQVYRLASADDKQFISSNNISYVFIPKIETNSSSKSAFTWPPTHFTVSLECKATDSSGSVIWSKEIKGEGEATFGEFKHNFPLAAKRAVKNAFSSLQKEIIQSGVFR